MEKLRTLLIDDNADHLNLLEKLLSAHSEIDIVEKTTDPTKVVEKTINHKPDLLFLDIEMPVKSGFEVIEELTEAKLQSEIIFVTSHDEYAIKAFEYAAFDYLIKPIDPERLKQCIKRIKEPKHRIFHNKVQKLQDTYNKLIYKSINGYTLIEPDDIVYIKADGNYSIIQLTNDRKDTFSLSVGEIENDLNENFFRTHRSLIINLKKLYKVNTKKRECILRDLENEYICKITKDRIQELLRIMR